MNVGVTEIEGLDHSQRVDSILAMVQDILTEMGIVDVTPDSVIAAPPFYDGRVLIQDTDRVNRFIFQFALKVRFIGYSVNDVAFLTVRQLCELYLRDSYPETPSVPLTDDQYELGRNRERKRAGVVKKDFPICFVLGCGRSGTTLLRTMLNVHEELWAPGELHLAHFESMADRARNIVPLLRYMLVPEVAARFGESIASFSKVLKKWELESLSVSEVYENLYEADPSTLIVDKTPTYSARLEDLKRIGQQFPNARFVYLVRSPHDVIRSLVRMQLYKGVLGLVEPGLNPYQVGEVIWSSHNSNIQTFLGDVPNERKCTVRYEELVSDAETPLRRVCDLLDLSYDADMVDPYRKSPGKVALGAGDMYMNFLRRVENRTPSEAFYPIGMRCQNLADRYGY